jgi:uroporphyrinogen decarboxylase
MYGDPPTWHRLCEKLAALVADYAAAQVAAGVQAVQVFDSWVGVLNLRDYREFAAPHSKKVLDAIRHTGVPSIHFGTGTSMLLAEMRNAGGDVMGVDWRIPLDEAWERVGHDRGVQGNLDPTLALGPMDRMLGAAEDVLARAGGRPGHIFNFGHGVLPDTPLEMIQVLAKHVHRYSVPPVEVQR